MSVHAFLDQHSAVNINNEIDKSLNNLGVNKAVAVVAATRDGARNMVAACRMAEIPHEMIKSVVKHRENLANYAQTISEIFHKISAFFKKKCEKFQVKKRKISKNFRRGAYRRRDFLVPAQKLG
jgi:hypothetical protein